jgi:hypothetical protein
LICSVYQKSSYGAVKCGYRAVSETKAKIIYL